MQTHKQTKEKVQSIFPRLVWHNIDKKIKMTNDKFKKINIVIIAGDWNKTYYYSDRSNIKTIYRKIQICITNNIYNNIMNDEENTPTTYKTS